MTLLLVAQEDVAHLETVRQLTNMLSLALEPAGSPMASTDVSRRHSIAGGNTPTSIRPMVSAKSQHRRASLSDYRPAQAAAGCGRAPSGSDKMRRASLSVEMPRRSSDNGSARGVVRALGATISAKALEASPWKSDGDSGSSPLSSSLSSPKICSFGGGGYRSSAPSGHVAFLRQVRRSLFSPQAAALSPFDHHGPLNNSTIPRPLHATFSAVSPLLPYSLGRAELCSYRRLCSRDSLHYCDNNILVAREQP